MIRFADIGDQPAGAHEHQQADSRVEIASFRRQEPIPGNDGAESNGKDRWSQAPQKADNVTTG